MALLSILLFFPLQFAELIQLFRQEPKLNFQLFALLIFLAIAYLSS
jgi:hypothetical protein